MTCVEYQESCLEELRNKAFVPSQMTEVTVVAYYFQTEERLDLDFWRTEFAFLKTFETQGLMKAALVVNKSTDAIRSFCDKYDIEVQIAPHLVPGEIKTLALDLVENLHSRFGTDYVLTVQDDGFPLRSGLEEFVGRFDYVGAPWVHHNTYYDLYPYMYCVGNGGFSLRSKRICEAASRYYRKYFKWMPYWWYVLGDDVFYCKTLRFWFPGFRNRFRWASPEEASLFSLEHNIAFLSKTDLQPIGFHGEVGFRNVNFLRKYIVS